ncbi:hypothetical protein [Sphingobacterium cellulitidis]|uniref:hypothetical protein n=1 Tax=Sphingobacterium cellulitidis TaxID=1768011 RepID=UPI000B94155F|nr:hypothetical protein CHT99_15605 [Sphingobacterium cellulitidis]
MNTENIKKELVATLVDQKELIKVLKVPHHYNNWFTRFLSSIKVLPKFKSKKIYLSDPKPGTIVKLLGELIDLKISKTMNDLEIYEMIKINIPIFINFLAISFHNKKGNPPAWLIDGISYQFEKSEIQKYSLEVYRRLDLQTFFGITGSMVNLNQMVGSILEGEAHTTSSETAVSTMDGPKSTLSGK